MSLNGRNPRLRNRVEARVEEECGWNQHVYRHEYVYTCSRFSLWRTNSRILWDRWRFSRLFELSGNHGRLVIANRFNGTYIYMDHVVKNVSFFFPTVQRLECCRHERITTWLRVFELCFLSRRSISRGLEREREREIGRGNCLKKGEKRGERNKIFTTRAREMRKSNNSLVSQTARWVNVTNKICTDRKSNCASTRQREYILRNRASLFCRNSATRFHGS